MRHFNNALRDDNFNVNYVHYNDQNNQGGLLAQVKYALNENTFDEVRVNMPGTVTCLKAWSNGKIPRCSCYNLR